MSAKKIKSAQVLPTPALSAIESPLLLDIKKAAARLGVGVWTLREWYWAKRIVGRKLGRGKSAKIYFTPQELERFVREEFGEVA